MLITFWVLCTLDWYPSFHLNFLKKLYKCISQNVNHFYKIGAPTEYGHHICSQSSQTKANSFNKHLTKLNDSVCFLCPVKYLIWINWCFYMSPWEREPFESGSTDQATSYLVNGVPVSLGRVMSSLDVPGWETGMLQPVDWRRRIVGRVLCKCFYFNVWNEETMEKGPCVCSCICTPMCMYGGFAATLLCEDLSQHRPAVRGGVCGLPVHSQQTNKAK